MHTTTNVDNQSRRTQSVLLLFFGLLIGLLFMGDGRTSLVDFAGAAVTIVMSVVALLFLKPSKLFPAVLLYPWVGLLSFMGVMSLLSLDVGLSIVALIRYVDAYIIFYIFYRYPIGKNDTQVIRYISIFCVITIVTSILLSAFPRLHATTPTMNLFWSNAGHNHVTDVVLFALFPLLYLIDRHTRLRYVGIAIIMGIFVFSQARIALGVATLVIAVYYTFFYEKQTNKAPPRMVYLMLVAIFSLVIAFMVPEMRSLLPKSVQLRISPKTTLRQDKRLDYWSQATRAIQESPLVGNGPGTFPLLSTKLQATPGISSWFAHNYLLETASDIGMIGLGLFLWVISVSYIRPLIHFFGNKHQRVERLIIVCSPCVLLVYGLVDFSLNYFVVWLLFWAVCGMTARYE